MAFYHRKMFSEFFNATISQTCDFYCDTSRNKLGYCPTLCLSICSENCREFTQFPSLGPPHSPPPTFIDHRTKQNKFSFFLTLSLSLLAATFFIFFCYTLYKYYTERPRSMRRRSQTETEETHDDFLDEDHGPVLDHPIWYIRTIGLQPSIINAITVCKYKRGDGLVEGTDCSVCLNEFQEDETLRLLPKCNHAFHIPCIDTWLRSHTNCPMCRAGIVSNSPPPEQNVEISVLGEEIQEGTLENSTESGSEREDGACELRIGIEEGDELQVENETKRQEVANSDLSEGDEVQPRRRSVSLDSSSASMISLAIANALPVQSDGNSGNQLVKMNESNRGFVPKRFDVNKSLLKLMGTSSIGRSLPRGPISMKRSLSCSGKVLLSRYSRSRNRNRNLVLPQ